MFRQISLLHVIEMEKEVLSIDVRHDEPITLAFIEKLQPASHLILQVIHVRGLILLIEALPIQTGGGR